MTARSAHTNSVSRTAADVRTRPREAASEITRPREVAPVRTPRRPARKRRVPLLLKNLLAVIIVIVAAGFVFYPVLQNEWKVHRDIQQIQAEIDAVNARNNQIQAQIDTLATPAGIASRAREQFGWVYPGEKAVNILGLDDEIHSSTSLPASVIPGSVELPVDWFTATLDKFFDYHYLVDDKTNSSKNSSL